MAIRMGLLDVVNTKDNQSIDGTKAFNLPIVLNATPTLSNHAVRLQDLNSHSNTNVYATAPTLEDFKNFCVSNSCPVGVTIYMLNFGGSVATAIVAKANNNYLSFIEFSYGIKAIQYQYNNGLWSTIPLG